MTAIKHEADPDLINKINQFRNHLIRQFFYSVLIVLGGSVLTYITRGGLNLIFLLTTFFCLLALTYILYNQFKPSGHIVNKTVIEITIETNGIVVVTSPFKVLFWVNEPSQEFIFHINELKIRQGSYPIKPIFDLEGGILRFTDREKEVYVIVGSFDEELRERLTALKG